MRLQDYKHIEFNFEVNKNMIPITEMSFSEYETWNKLYMFAKSHLLKVNPTKSSAIPNGPYSGKYRYMVVNKNQSYELVIVCKTGCYRFILEPSKLAKNTVSGRKSVLELYKIMDKYNIDFGKYACDDGLKVKESIEKPLIQVMMHEAMDKRIKHMYHLDLNSSYWSRIVEAYPELKEIASEMYANRKNDNDKFKHILTNSVGCFQSAYCPKWGETRKSSPYQFANLSKIAINGTREKVLNLLSKLKEKGMIPILTNTDGIWYYSSKGAYHDEDEGTELCQWKNDHCDCEFIMTSAGSYQYLENGVCHTVLRGTSNLDQIKRREDWEFGDILRVSDRKYYYFEEERGVVEDYEKI